MNSRKFMEFRSTNSRKIPRSLSCGCVDARRVHQLASRLLANFAGLTVILLAGILGSEVCYDYDPTAIAE
jgi:hypothetical protein